MPKEEEKSGLEKAKERAEKRAKEKETAGKKPLSTTDPSKAK